MKTSLKLFIIRYSLFIIICSLFIVHCNAQIVHCNAQWEQTSFSAQCNINCLDTSGTNIFAGGSGGGVFLSTDNGISWNAVNTGLPNAYVYSLAISGVNIFVGGGMGVFLSTDNGGSWTAENTGLPDVSIQALAISGTNIFAGTGVYGSLFLSTNNGATWVSDTTGLIYHNGELTINCFAISGGNIFAGTDAEGVFLSTNNGGTWTAVNTGLTTADVLSIVISGKNIFAGTDGRGVFLSTNNGGSWTAMNNGLINTHVTSLAISGKNIFAGTDGGEVFLSTNNGGSWTAENTGLTASDVFSLAISGGYIFAGTNEAIWKRASTNLVNPLPAEEICYVEFDTTTSKNSINWSTNLSDKIDTVHIYTESSGKWKRIGTVSARKSNFIDMNSNPQNQSYSYKISVKDTCGFETDSSAFHSTITLLSTYNSGTKTYGFTWSAYQGLTVTNYYLYGITANNADSLIGTVSPPNSLMYNYTNPYLGFVKFFVGFYTAPCSEKSNHLVRSNYVEKTTGVNENAGIDNLVSLYPNPVNDIVTIDFKGYENGSWKLGAGSWKIELYNIMGGLIKTLPIQSTLTQVNISDLSEGVYIVKVMNENGVAVKRVVKE